MTGFSSQFPPVPALTAGLRAHCSRCGLGRLNRDYLRLREKCEVCRLEFDFADNADGFAIFVMLIVGFIVTAGALAAAILYQPFYWVHGTLWLPSTVILSLGLLRRPLKVALFALQDRLQATEGRLLFI